MKIEITTVQELKDDIKVLKNDLENVKNGLYTDIFTVDGLTKEIEYKQEVLKKWIAQGRQ